MRTQPREDENRPVFPGKRREIVVLVHGIWMTGLELRWLGGMLRRCGFMPRYFHYRSLRDTPRESAVRLGRFLTELRAERIHLVGHSLGGIVLLHLFDLKPELPPGRVVFLGSPVRGSGVARHMEATPWLHPFLGRSGERGVLGGVPPWRDGRELGVIAGSTRSALGIGRLIGGVAEPSDGTVAVAETRIPEATACCVLNHSHTGMLFSRRVAAEICRFLQQGRFLECDAMDT
jgi:pimeloyl-ACP methyl ester carboxylesterase